MKENKNKSSFFIAHNIKNFEIIQNFFEGRLSVSEKVKFNDMLLDPLFVDECERFTNLLSGFIGSN